jgi:hypothetical protein
LVFPAKLQSIYADAEGTNESSALAVQVCARLLLVININKKSEEQLQMNDCYYDKKDWRACRKEVSELSENFSRTRILLTAVADGGIQRMLEEEGQ